LTIWATFERVVPVTVGLIGTILLTILTTPFYSGEEVHYSMLYGPLPAGMGSLTVTMESIDGDSVYHISSVMRTNRLFSLFYRIDDKLDSYFTPDSFQSVRFAKSIREGSHKENISCDFFHEDGVAVYSDGDTVELVPGSRDYLTTLYHVRKLDLEENDEIVFLNHIDKKNYELKVKVVGRDTLVTQLDEFECVVVDLVSETGGMFAEGSLRAWLTDDARRIPVQLKAKTRVGSIVAEIRRLELGERGSEEGE
jgi:hypothetical protein